MNDSPDDAYKAAKANREKRIQEEASAQNRAEAFPKLAEQKLQEIDAALKAAVPDGLSLETKLGPGGLLGRRGIKSLFLIIKERDGVVAQGGITCSKDEMIALQGFPPEKDDRPQKDYKETSFDAFTPEVAISFLTDLIKTYI